MDCTTVFPLNRRLIQGILSSLRPWETCGSKVSVDCPDNHDTARWHILIPFFGVGQVLERPSAIVAVLTKPDGEGLQRAWEVCTPPITK